MDKDLISVSADKIQANAIEWSNNQDWIMRVSRDGKVTFNENLTPEEGAKVAWDLLMRMTNQKTEEEIRIDERAKALAEIDRYCAWYCGDGTTEQSQRDIHQCWDIQDGIRCLPLMGDIFPSNHQDYQMMKEKHARHVKDIKAIDKFEKDNANGRT